MMQAAPFQSGDQAARERIRASLHESLLVEASAGTGKTSELVRRIVAALAEGLTTVGRIVAVTFTNKAAGELKLRLRQDLDRERARSSGDRERNLEEALARLEEASIGTIHAFCGQLLRERPVEAGVDPAFQELTEREAEGLYNRAFQSWFQERLNQPSPGLRRALTRMAWPDPWEDSSPIDQLKWAGRSLLEWRDHRAEWGRPELDRDDIIDRLVTDLQQRAAKLSSKYQPVHELVEWINRSEVLIRRDYDTLEARLVKLQRDLKQKHRRGLEDLLAVLEEFTKVMNIDLAAQLRSEMMDLVERYEQRKRQMGRLDFLDLLLLARDLVKGNAEVRRYLQGRFTHLFIDEFQDTDPLQAELLLLLSADDTGETDWRKVTPVSGKLFAVGDPKQSIYKFRRADVALYQTLRGSLVEKGVGVVQLSKSYRSVRPIQECVNAAFEPEMTQDIEAGQIGYSPLEEHAPAPEGRPSVVVLPVPEPYGARDVTKSAINRSLPGSIVGFTEWLIRRSGWCVREGEGGATVPIAPRHICILFRRRTDAGKDITRDYTRMLEARGIPHLLAGSKSFHAREEVETLRTALTAIEWPSDELSVFATLRGSLFAIDDATLLRYRQEAGRLRPFRPAEGAGASFAAVTGALAVIDELHRSRNSRPVADTINLLLEATRAHAGFGLRPGGHQALANIYRVADLARGFEIEGGISFRGFVEMLMEKAEKGETSEASVLEEGAEGVRLMTVHAAKGLEFPVVILADMTAKLCPLEPDRYVNSAQGLCAMRLLRCLPFELMDNLDTERRREAAEGVRVAYVAATRARDLLVVPAVGDLAQEGWLSPLNKAIYPPRDRFRQAGEAEGCPKFGARSVLDRPAIYLGEEEFSVRPGLHRPQTGSHDVVWWDPALLEVNAPANFGLELAEILAEGSDESRHKYQSWMEEREALLTKGSTPAQTVFTATEAPAPPENFEVTVSVVTAGVAGVRPRGARFGSLVHAILRDAEDGSEERLFELARLHGRLLGAPGDEIEAARDAASAAMSHELLKEARSAEGFHREMPVVLREGKRVFEGVIDCAYFAGGMWTVLDYKTDAGEAFPSHYTTQVKWYAYALHRLTGSPVRAFLLRV